MEGKMFDFSKLGDMSKLAKEAKDLQSKQEDFNSKQLELLKKISLQLEELISLIKSQKL